jgi:hypothetical protein
MLLCVLLLCAAHVAACTLIQTAVSIPFDSFVRRHLFPPLFWVLPTYRLALPSYLNSTQH